MNIKHILVPLVFLACIVSSYASARKLFAAPTTRPSFTEFLKQMSGPSKPQAAKSKVIKQQKTVKKKKIKTEKASQELEESIARFLDSHIPPLAKGLSEIVKGKEAEGTIKKKIEKRTARIKKSEASRKASSSRSSSYRSSYRGSSYWPSSYSSPYKSSYSPYSASPYRSSSSSYSSPYSGFSRPSSYSSPYSGYSGSPYSSGGSSNSWDRSRASSSSSKSSDDSSSRGSFFSPNDAEKETEEKRKSQTIIKNIRAKFGHKLQEINQDALKNPGLTSSKIITFAEGIKKELELLKTTQDQLSEKEQAADKKMLPNPTVYTAFVPHLFNAFPSFLAKKELDVEGFQLIVEELSRVVSKETLEAKAAEFVVNFSRQQQIAITQAEKAKSTEQINSIISVLEGVKTSFPIAVTNMTLLEAPLARALGVRTKLNPSPPPAAPAAEAAAAP